jgi:NTP pyrophosphatase (non-canonical NTP hydrolase)
MYGIGDKEWPGLAKLIEEAGEVQQVIGKLMALGGDCDTPHFDGQGPLRERIENELADLSAALIFVAQHNAFDQEKINRRVKYKLARFENWHVQGTKP